MKDGIINLLKPAGMTSHDAVYFLRRLTGEKKIGHTGTLDPMAVGVLPLCMGNATKIIEYLEEDKKSYRCEMLLGMTTDTQDIWGTVLEDKRGNLKNVTEEQIGGALMTFRGEISQIPPMYSSVRVHGRHLYDYARSGEQIEIKPREVDVEDIRLISWNENTGRAIFDIVCSKGTYVRSICRDVGEILGCGAAMSFLVRTSSGMFRIEDTVTPEEFSQCPEKYLQAADLPLQRLGRLEIPESRRKWYSQGGYIRQREGIVTRMPERPKGSRKTRFPQERTYCVYCGGDFLGVSIYYEEKKQFLADKVFQK